MITTRDTATSPEALIPVRCSRIPDDPMKANGLLFWDTPDAVGNPHATCASNCDAMAVAETMLNQRFLSSSAAKPAPLDTIVYTYIQ